MSPDATIGNNALTALWKLIHCCFRLLRFLSNRRRNRIGFAGLITHRPLLYAYGDVRDILLRLPECGTIVLGARLQGLHDDLDMIDRRRDT